MLKKIKYYIYAFQNLNDKFKNENLNFQHCELPIGKGIRSFKNQIIQLSKLFGNQNYTKQNVNEI